LSNTASQAAISSPQSAAPPNAASANTTTLTVAGINHPLLAPG
jgi:hypothetical protein